MELMLQAECPAFNKMSTETMMSNLINVIKTYFSKPPEPEQMKPRPPRPHEHEIKRLRRQLRDLRKTWRQRSTEPPGDTLELRQAFHATHRRLKRLTAESRACRLTSKRQSTLRQFRADPFRFGQRLFKHRDPGLYTCKWARRTFDSGQDHHSRDLCALFAAQRRWRALYHIETCINRMGRERAFQRYLIRVCRPWRC